MATETAVYKLIKPAPADYYNIDDYNAAMDRLEAALVGHDTALAGKAARSHTHTQAEVTGLPAALAGKATTATYTVTIPTTGWAAGSGQYTRTLAVSGILAADNPVCDVALSATAATRANQIKAWAVVELITTAAGSITLYASTVPTVALTLRLKVVR